MAGTFLALVLTIFSGLIGITLAADGDVRLRPFDNGHTGRIEVEYNQQFGAVCLDNFDIQDAEVVCKQLGFRYGALKVVQASAYGWQGTDPTASAITLFDVNCAGNEPNLAACRGARWSGSCDQSRAAAVFCALPYYEGCYRGGNDVLPLSNSGNTLDGLVSLCRLFSYDYAASSQSTGDSNDCYNSATDFGTRVADSNCDGVCSGDDTELCGGTGEYRAVYSTRLGSSGYSLTADSGTITSPNYPGEYPANMIEEWTVTLSSSSSENMQFSFPVLNIRSGDRLMITAGGVVEEFTTNRVWVSNTITSFVVRFESGSSESAGFVLNFGVALPPTTPRATTPRPTTTEASTTVPPPPPPSPPTPSMTTRSQPVATTRETTTVDETTTQATTVPGGFTPLTTTGFIIIIVVLCLLFFLALILSAYFYCNEGSLEEKTKRRDNADGAPISSAITSGSANTYLLPAAVIAGNAGNDQPDYGGSYMQPMSTIESDGKMNGIDNPLANGSSSLADDQGFPPPPPDHPPVAVDDAQVAIDMPDKDDVAHGGSTPYQNMNIVNAPESSIPEDVPSASVPMPSVPEEQPTIPEIPDPDYDEEAIPPPPLSPPPPPPPEFASPVEDHMAEQPSSVLSNQDVLY